MVIFPPPASIITACCWAVPILMPFLKSVTEAIDGVFSGSLPPPSTISPPLVLISLPGLTSMAPPFCESLSELSTTFNLFDAEIILSFKTILLLACNVRVASFPDDLLIVAPLC